MSQYHQPINPCLIRGSGIAGFPVVFAVVLLAVGVSGCQDAIGHAAAQEVNPDAKASSGRTNENAPRVNTVRVERQDLLRTVEMPGTVEGYEMAELYAKVGGYLGSIAVDIGDEVNKGDELAQLWMPELQQEVEQKEAAVRQAEAEVAQAAAAVTQSQASFEAARAAEDEARTGLAEHEAQLRFRQAEFARYQELASKQAVSQSMLDEAQYRFEAAQAAVKAARARVTTATAEAAAAEAFVAKSQADQKSNEAQVAVAKADAQLAETMQRYAVIRAPFDGVITRRNVDAGAFIRPGDQGGAALLKIARVDRVRVAVDIPMADTSLLDRGDRAVLSRVTPLPGRLFEGQISRFSPAVDKVSRLARVEVDLDNAGRRLMPGYYGYMTIHLAEEKDTPVVPASALLSDGEGAYVLVVKNGLAERRDVEINYQDGSIVGVASGLSSGEEVILSGTRQLTAGQPVVPVLAKK